MGRSCPLKQALCPQIKKLVAAGTLKVDHPKLTGDAFATVDPAVSSESLVGLKLQLQQAGETAPAPEIARLPSDE